MTQQPPPGWGQRPSWGPPPPPAPPPPRGPGGAYFPQGPQGPPPPPYWQHPPPKKGLPGWGIALIIFGIVALLSVPVVVVALLGGGDEEAGSPPAPVAGQATLTRAEYIRQGDAICDDMYRKYAAIPDPERNDSGARIASLYEQEVTVFRTGFAQLKSLRPPPEIQTLADQMNANADQMVVNLSSAASAARSERNKAYSNAIDAYNDSLNRFGAAARQIGFVGECADFGTP